jgi:hypothetical protein
MEKWNTSFFKNKAGQIETDNKRRLCQQFDETIDHIILACPILAKERYLRRHDRVCAQLHFQHMHENRSTIGQKTLAWASAKIGRNKSRRQGKPYCGINKYKLTELSPTTKHTL